MDTSWKDAKSVEIPQEAIMQSLENEQLIGTEFSITKQSPFLLAGIAGLIAACGVGAYKWKTAKHTMRPSLFLTQLRVIAQGTVIAFITVGMAYNTYQDYVSKKK